MSWDDHVIYIGNQDGQANTVSDDEDDVPGADDPDDDDEFSTDPAGENDPV